MAQTAESTEAFGRAAPGLPSGPMAAQNSAADEARDLVVALMPEWQGRSVTFEILPGGTSNVNYIVHVDGEQFVIKVLTEAMDDLGLRIPIRHVLANTEAAGRTGLGAHILRTFPDLSALVFEKIVGHTLNVSDMVAPENIPRLGRAVRTLHDTADPFANRIDFFDFLDSFLRLVDEHSLPTPSSLLDFLPVVGEIRVALAVNPLAHVPAHNDLLSSNIMDDGRIRLIDYDFSAMNDPCFDLGDLAMEADYDPDQVEVLCHSYFGTANPTQLARTKLYGIVAQYTWAVWETLMDRLLENKPDPDFDYHKEAEDRWAWARRKLEGPEFGSVIDAARTRT